MEDEALIRAIEQASLWAWPPERTAGVGGWLLRQGATATRRQNSVQTLAFSGETAIEAAIAKVETWYATHDRRACYQLTDLSRPARLDKVLAAGGYALEAPSNVMTRSLATSPSQPSRVNLEGRPTAFVMDALTDPYMMPAERAARALLFARIKRPMTFAVMAEHGSPTAGGLCVVDGRLAGVFAMRTGAPSRRRGQGRAVLARLLGWACAMGAQTAYLQVEATNLPAIALYRGFGFKTLYDYHYRISA